MVPAHGLLGEHVTLSKVGWQEVRGRGRDEAQSNMGPEGHTRVWLLV